MIRNAISPLFAISIFLNIFLKIKNSKIQIPKIAAWNLNIGFYGL